MCVCVCVCVCECVCVCVGGGGVGGCIHDPGSIQGQRHVMKKKRDRAIGFTKYSAFRKTLLSDYPYEILV